MGLSRLCFFEITYKRQLVALCIVASPSTCATFHTAGIATMDVLLVLVFFLILFSVQYVAGIMGRLSFIYFFLLLDEDNDEHCEMTCPSCDMNCTFVDQSQCLRFHFNPRATSITNIWANNCEKKSVFSLCTLDTTDDGYLMICIYILHVCFLSFFLCHKHKCGKMLLERYSQIIVICDNLLNWLARRRWYYWPARESSFNVCPFFFLLCDLFVFGPIFFKCLLGKHLIDTGITGARWWRVSRHCRSVFYFIIKATTDNVMQIQRMRRCTIVCMRLF